MTLVECAYLLAVLLPTFCTGLAAAAAGENSLDLPHVTSFGNQISDSACQTRDLEGEFGKILSGAALPYAFRGPHQACNNSACQHDYWLARSRWDGHFAPACPVEARRNLVARLSQQAKQGSDWLFSALTTKPCDLWPHLRGRTVWVIGDSLSQDFATSLVCFMMEYMYWEGKPISHDPEVMQRLTKSASGKDMSAWCLHFEESTRICSLRANKVARMVSVVLPLLPQIADREKDIAILNLGAWYNYMEDGMAELQKDMIEFEAAFNSHRHQLPKRTIWRECTAQHFNTTSGMFDPTATIAEQRCVRAGSKMGLQLGLDSQKNLVFTGPTLNETWELDVMLRGGHRNVAIQPVIDRMGLPTLRIWNVSLVLHEFHNNYHKPESGGECVYVECDCSHACSPSWYQLMLADFKQWLQYGWDISLPKRVDDSREGVGVAVS